MADADLTQIDGVDVMTAMTILSEVGWGMSKWKTEHQTQILHVEAHTWNKKGKSGISHFLPALLILAGVTSL